jgi:hypothetical protein
MEGVRPGPQVEGRPMSRHQVIRLAAGRTDYRTSGGRLHRPSLQKHYNQVNGSYRRYLATVDGELRI